MCLRYGPVYGASKRGGRHSDFTNVVASSENIGFSEIILLQSKPVRKFRSGMKL